MGKRISAWHFLKDDYRLQFGDRRKIAAGDTVRVNGPPVLCRRGLHGSKRILDALRYAPGPILCRVLIGGQIVQGDDKLAGTTRYVEWTLDAKNVLHEFACRVVEDALRTAGVTDNRCWDAIFVKRLWLAGEASDEELAAAKDAAWAAAWEARAAAGNAAWAAAKDAAWAAAWEARAAARDAAMDAAWAAAMAAARDAAWDAQNALLETLIDAVPFERA